MKKEIFVLAFFVIALSFSLLAFFGGFLKNDEKASLDELSNNETDAYLDEEKSIPQAKEIITGEGLREVGSFESDSEKALLKEENNEPPICILVRPGNLPDITCSVNYIYRDEISIRLRNELGENLGIIIRLEECRPEIIEELKNDEEKSFVFFCESKGDFFDEQISISYIINQTERIEINGFVMGAIQLN